MPTGFFAHLSDTAGYVAWWVFPRPTAHGGGIRQNYTPGKPPEPRRAWA